MRAKASAACCAFATPAGSAAGPTTANRLETKGQRSSACPASSRASSDGAWVITTSRSPRAADCRICPEGPITVTTRAPDHSESRTSSAPDCCTVYVVPNRNGRGALVQAASAAHICAAIRHRSLYMRRPSTSFLYVVPLRLSLFFALAPSAAAAQGFQLTVENIMRGADLVGTAPSNVRFSADGRYVYFRWRSPGADTADQDYRAAVTGGNPERLARFALDTIAMADGAWSPDRTREVVVLKGDLWLVDRRGVKRRLSETVSAESNPGWSADGRTVFFTRDGNAWALDVDGGAERQLTDVRRGPAPKSPADPTGEKKFLRDQQRELFDFIRRQVAEQRVRADSDTTGRKPVWLPETQTVARFETSPDGRFVLATVADRPPAGAAEAAQQVTMPVWVTQSGFVETQQIRTKVGDTQTHQRAVVIDVATGKATWIERDSVKSDNVAVGFSPNGRHALVRISSTDFKDSWLVVVDLPTLARREVAHLHDDAWLGVDGFLGPGAWSGWLGDGETVYYASEETGFAHLYMVPVAGGAARALTSGEWEVQEVRLSPDKRTFYLETNEGDFGQVHFYAMPVNGGPRVRLTAAEGRQDVVVSPDGATLAVLQSTANHPTELYLQGNRAGAAARQLTESTTPEWRRFGWIKPEIVAIPASDGVQVPARIYRPTGASNHAAVIFVH